MLQYVFWICLKKKKTLFVNMLVILFNPHRFRSTRKVLKKGFLCTTCIVI